MRCMATSTPPSTTPTSPASNVSSYASTRSTPLSSGTTYHTTVAWQRGHQQEFSYYLIGRTSLTALAFLRPFIRAMGKPKLSNRRLRSTIIVVAEETKLFVKPNDPIRICSGYAMARKRALKRTVGGWAQCELWQQTILESTALVATTEGLDGNTPFSAQLHNHLTINKLPQQESI